MKKIEQFMTYLTTIAETQNKSFVMERFQIELVDLLKSNDLASDAQLPDWVVDFMACIASQQEKERTFFIHHAAGEGDVICFLADLEEWIDAEYDDYGEGYIVTYSKLKMQGIIILEGDCYEVRCLNT